MANTESLDPEPHSEAQLRFVVVGSSGSGKTTLAKALSNALGVPHVELDAFFHGPDWEQTPEGVFRGLVEGAVESDGWVVDGNYHIARAIAWSRATTLVWLDYSFPRVFARLFKRTILRGIRGAELWNGNREKLWWHFFTRKSMFLWLVQTYWKRRREYTAAITQPEYGHLKVYRFRSPTDADRWLREVIARRL